MATAKRIYVVTIGAIDRLVRAAHPSHALMHVARDIASVRVAGQDDLVHCLTGGAKVEDCGAAATAEAEAEAKAAAQVQTPKQQEIITT